MRLRQYVSVLKVCTAFLFSAGGLFFGVFLCVFFFFCGVLVFLGFFLYLVRAIFLSYKFLRNQKGPA